jgi:hypothetical protein
MRDSNRFDPLHRDQPLTWWSRVGVTGIAFFLVKGLLWLLAPALVALMR